MRPEHIFPYEVEEWDRNVFLGASHFTVVVPRVGKYDDIATFPEALKLVGDSRRALIYAVTQSGRSTCLERKRWDVFLQLWNSVKQKLNAALWEKIKAEAAETGSDPYTMLLRHIEMDPKQFKRAKKGRK